MHAQSHTNARVPVGKYARLVFFVAIDTFLVQNRRVFYDKLFPEVENSSNTTFAHAGGTGISIQTISNLIIVNTPLGYVISDKITHYC